MEICSLVGSLLNYPHLMKVVGGVWMMIVGSFRIKQGLLEVFEDLGNFPMQNKVFKLYSLYPLS